jgi:hypothetical protein
MAVERQVELLARAEQTIARRELKLGNLLAQQEEAHAEVAVAKERLALAVLRERGLLDLPAAGLVDVLRSFRDVPADMGQRAVSATAAPVQAKKPAAEEATAMQGTTVPVVVRFSAHPGAEKRALFKKTRLHWNGKKEWWRGKVTPGQLEQLQQTFPGRVSVLEGADAEVAPAAEGPAPQPTTATTATAAEPQRAAAAAPDARDAVPPAGADEQALQGSAAVQTGSAEPAAGPPPARPRRPAQPLPFGRVLR